MERITEVNKIQLTQEELEKIIAQAIAKYRKEETQSKSKDMYNETYEVMKIYRDVAIHIESGISEAKEIKGMTEKEKQQYVQQIRNSKLHSIIKKNHIDKALEELEKRKREQGKEQEYEAFRLYFLEGKTYEKIAEELCCSESSPRRFVTRTIRELEPFLWGYEAIKY